MLLALTFAALTVPAGTIQVGPGKPYKTIQAGIDAAVDGDTIEVDAGDYPSTAVKIGKSSLTLKGVGGRPHLSFSGNIPNDKGILVVEVATVHDIIFENLEISGAQGASGNAAAIRFQGKNLTVRDCFLHHSQNGILEGNGAVSGSVVLIERTEFAFNGVADSGYEHNMYISEGVQSFTLRYSYSHHAKEGHLVKSRAKENYIIANRIMDELPVSDGGTTDQSSALIDLPQGGRAYVVGNLLHKGANSQNKNAAIWFGGENGNNAPHELYVVNNTYVSATASSTTAMVLGKRAAIVFIANNLSLGDGVTLLNWQPAESASGRVFTVVNNYVDDALDKLALFNGATSATADISYSVSGNQHLVDALLVDRAGFDWHLMSDSPAINAGVDPGTAHGFSLTPTAQYLHPTQGETRPQIGPLDVGAYEAQSGTPIGQEEEPQPPEDGDGGEIITGPPSPNAPAPPPPVATNNTSDMLAQGATLSTCASVSGSSWTIIGVLLIGSWVRARAGTRRCRASML